MPIVIIDDNGCKTSCRTVCGPTRKKRKSKKKKDSINYALLAAVMHDQRKSRRSTRKKKSSYTGGTPLLGYGGGGGGDDDGDDGISVWGDPYSISGSSYWDDDEDGSSFPASFTSSASNFTFSGSSEPTLSQGTTGTISSLTQDSYEDGSTVFDSYQNYVPSYNRPAKRSRVFNEFSNVVEVN